MTTMPLGRRAFLLLLALAAVWFGSLEYRKLIRPDEGRYAEIPREMMVTGDWVTPRLDGLKYFEKPALQYWATATAFVVFGEHDWSARLWPALTGFLCLLLAAWIATRLFNADAGIYALAVLASSPLYLTIGHANTLDMGFTFFLNLALFAFVRGQEEDADARRWRLLVWAALALAVLSKGIAALLLTGGTLVLYSLANRDFAPWRRLEIARGLPLFLLIAAPWFVIVSLRNPEFFQFFFIHEHFERFLTKVHGRYEPWWYFVEIFALTALPWTLIAVHAAYDAWFLDRPGRFAARRFLVIWLIVVFGFFSASSSKLASYILPIFPAFAVLSGEFLTRCRWRTLFKHVLAIALLAAIALVVVSLYAPVGDEEQPTEMLLAYKPWIIAAAALWLIGSIAGLWLLHKTRVRAAVVTLAVLSGCAGLSIVLGLEELSPSQSGFQIAAQIKPQLPPGVPFYSVQTYDQTLPYYLDRTITLVSYEDEFVFGQQQEPAKAIATVEEFERRWRADPDAFALMRRDTYAGLTAHQLPMRIVASDTRHLVVRKP